MYWHEAKKIVEDGGKVWRVVVDYELKKRIFPRLATARQTSPDVYREAQETIGREHGLTVVDGKLPLPDLRIEYETPGGEIAKVDPELATDHYKPGQLSEKSRAGFRIYWLGSDRTGSSAVREDRELTAEILSILRANGASQVSWS